MRPVREDAPLLPQARIVAQLRRAGIPVEEIAAYFAHPDGERLDRSDREIMQVSAARRRALTEARAALTHRTAPHSEGHALTSSFSAGAATHPGAGREINQDSFQLADGLFAVADGIGGLAGGEIASRLALDTLATAFAADRSIAGLLSACREANQAVWRQADREEASMGTTVVALAVTTDTGGVVVHAGDSRMYRFHNGRLDPLTQDHTVVAELMRAGDINEVDAEDHPYRHVLTRAIGVGPDVDIDYAGVSWKQNDRLLLATDGLFKALSADDVRAILAEQTQPQEAADELVAVAVKRGSADDVTAVVVDVQAVSD